MKDFRVSLQKVDSSHPTKTRGNSLHLYSTCVEFEPRLDNRLS